MSAAVLGSDFLIFLHLVGASVWLGGLVTLAAVIVVAFRSLEREAGGSRQLVEWFRKRYPQSCAP